MEEQFKMFWNHPAVPGITLWGYIVGATWRDNTGLQHSNGTMRPALPRPLTVRRERPLHPQRLDTSS
ncbi:hypothetical protein BE20_06990 [Sorangium cellulosum]|nr:hypothetical protein BE20_06990 [Sorangium cellulosum]